jgi:hypothetical protein
MALSENEELARALGVASHPLRLDILDAFASGLIRSPIEAALALGEGLPNIRHHIRVLLREGFLAPVGAGGTGGAPGDRYEPTERARALIGAFASLT